MAEEARCTVNVTIHPWCHDPARDEAVRAAEDNRTGPLPTLEECIDNIASKGDDMATNGMRTERITLEVTHDLDARLSDWIVEVIDESLGLMESVRVVDEPTGSVDDRAYADRMGCDEERDFANRILDERDAAIRERDALRASAITQSLTADRFASAVKEADTLRARVAELEARTSTSGEVSRAAPAAKGGGESQCVSSGYSGSQTGDSGQDWHLASSGREPVAWMCEWTDHTSIYQSRIYAERAAAGDVVPQPLYREPPQPRGWLTEEERLALSAAITIMDGGGRTNIGVAINALLARSSPPEVVKPHGLGGPKLDQETTIDRRDRQWTKALDTAGVPWKEVPRG